MSIRLEQLNVSSVSKVFVTRIEMGNEIFKNVSEYMKTRITTNGGIEHIHSIGVDGLATDTFNLKVASNDTIGGVKLGRNVSIDGQDRLYVDFDKYQGGEGIEIVNSDNDEKIKLVNLDKATTESLGGIIAGNGLSIDSRGVLSVQATDIDTATEDQLGVVRVGTGLKADGQGILSVNYGEGIELDEEGRLTVIIPEVNTASKTVKGIVKVGNGIDVTPDGTISVTEYDLESYAGENIDFVGNKFNATKTTVGTGLTSTDLGNFTKRIDSKIATKAELGVVKIGEGINIDGSGIISNPNASTTQKGVMKLGQNLSLNGNTDAVDVILPIGSTSTKGMVQVGRNLTVESGVINADVSTDDINALISEINTLKLRYDAIASEVENLSNIIGNLGSSNIQGKFGSNFMVGSLVFNAMTGATVEFAKELQNSNYRVGVLTSIPTSGSQGELWIENKTSKGFTIRTSGSMVTSKCDWIVFMDDSDTTAFNKDTFPFQKGSATMKGSTGVNVTIPAMKDTNYGVFITALDSPLGTYGEVWVENKTTTGFTIKSSGATTGKVEFMVAQYGKDKFNTESCPIQVGHDTFNGNIPKIIQLPRPLSGGDYQVLIGLEGSPNGALGDYFIHDKSSEYFTVNTTGGSKIKFNYMIMGV